MLKQLETFTKWSEVAECVPIIRQQHLPHTVSTLSHSAYILVLPPPTPPVCHLCNVTELFQFELSILKCTLVFCSFVLEGNSLHMYTGYKPWSRRVLKCPYDA